MPTARVNGTELYYEVRGDGPPILLIMGSSGDAGHFEAFAPLLADEFTVVSYDRRGNGRSPAPPDWNTTSPEEQADDAAALLRELDLAPAAVFGTSAGGTFALCLLVRHPEVVKRMVIHEPVIAPLFDDPPAGKAALLAMGDHARGPGGPPKALEEFWRVVGGDANWEGLDPDLKARMIAHADTLAFIEVGSFEDFLPSDAELDAVDVPVLVLISEHGRPALGQAARRLAARLGVEPTFTPGTHTCYQDHPRELDATLRPFFREVS
jgi:pimeloyl-ACP methyl ester carboxylesterase